MASLSSPLKSKQKLFLSFYSNSIAFYFFVESKEAVFLLSVIESSPFHHVISVKAHLAFAICHFPYPNLSWSCVFGGAQ